MAISLLASRTTAGGHVGATVEVGDGGTVGVGSVGTTVAGTAAVVVAGTVGTTVRVVDAGVESGIPAVAVGEGGGAEMREVGEGVGVAGDPVGGDCSVTVGGGTAVPVGGGAVTTGAPAGDASEQAIEISTRNRAARMTTGRLALPDQYVPSPKSFILPLPPDSIPTPHLIHFGFNILCLSMDILSIGQVYRFVGNSARH